MKIHNKFKLTIQNYQKTTEKYRECRDITQKLNNIASRTLILLAGKTKQTPLLPRHPMNFTKIKNLKKLELLKDINSIFLFRIKKKSNRERNYSLFEIQLLRSKFVLWSLSWQTVPPRGRELMVVAPPPSSWAVVRSSPAEVSGRPILGSSISLRGVE